jgi:hypothetical protein
MKKFCLILLALLVLASSAFATPGACVTAPMTTYMTAGFSCTINNLLTFSGFGYSGAGLDTGVAIPASAVMVVPITTPGDVGFSFQAPRGVSGRR